MNRATCPSLSDLLVGTVIEQILGPDAEGYVRLVVRRPGGLNLLVDVQADPEGNGPGTLTVLNHNATFLTQGGGR